MIIKDSKKGGSIAGEDVDVLDDTQDIDVDAQEPSYEDIAKINCFWRYAFVRLSES